MSDIANREHTREQGTGIVKPDDSNPYIAYGQAAARTRIIGKLLKFNKFGEWTAGEANDEMPEGTELVVHMGEFYVGWIRWEDAKPVEQVMGRVLDNFQPPRRSELGDTDKAYWPVDNHGLARDPWQFSNYLVMMDLESGQLYTYATASRGGLQAIGKLSEAYGRKMTVRPRSFPVVLLGSDEYQHPNKQFGTIKIPTLEIDGWTDRRPFDQALENKDTGGELEDPDQEDEPRSGPAPAKRRPVQSEGQTKPAAGDYGQGQGVRKSPKPRF
jgi:hypothetical protein